MGEEMAKYRQDLQNAASTQRRTMIVDAMPMIPEGPVSAPIPSRIVGYPQAPLITTVATQEPDANDWFSVMQQANDNKS